MSENKRRSGANPARSPGAWEVASRVVSGEDLGRAQRRRRGQWDALRTLWDCSTLDRVRACRRTPRGPTVALERREGRARFTGLTTCGSVWACPCCSARINAERADELRQAVESWHARGGTVALLTLTMRHRRGVSLATYWDALSPALAASLGGRYSRARKAKEAAGAEGHVIARECTHGANGWHLHAHALIFLNSPSPDAIGELGAAMYAAWAARLKRQGLSTPSLRHGVDLRVLNLSAAREHAARYLAKGTFEATRAAGELAGGDGKAARPGNRTPWDVLADLTAKRTPQDLAIWREWETASRGRRALTWSVGLRKRLGLGDELADEEITDDDDEPSELIARLTPEIWRIVRARRHGPSDLLRAAERGSPDEARQGCARLLRRWASRAGPQPRAGPRRGRDEKEEPRVRPRNAPDGPAASFHAGSGSRAVRHDAQGSGSPRRSRDAVNAAPRRQANGATR